MLRLVLPSIKYKTSFLKALIEVKKAPKSFSHAFAGLDYNETKKNFSAFCKKLNDRRKGKNLPKGYVPDSFFWLVDGDTYMGRVSIRHYLTPNLRKIGGHIGYEIRPSKRGKGYGTKILKFALPKARDLGIKKVLVTCDADNVASRRIIEANNGVFEKSEPQGKGKPKKLVFWINLKK
jgi:predicted acetyltransferase